MIAFADFFPEEMYNRLFSTDAITQRRNEAQSGLANYVPSDLACVTFLCIKYLNSWKNEEQNPEFKKVVKEFFFAKNNANELGLIPNLEGHEIDQADAWNEFVTTKQNPTIYHWFDNVLFEIFNQVACSARYAFDDNGDIIGRVENISYELFTKTIDTGTVDELASSRDWTCGVDDCRYKIDFKNWSNFKLIGFNAETYKNYDIFPIAHAKIQEIEIEFKTGNLIISDWFSDKKNLLKEYTKKADDLEYSDRSIKSVSSSLGREQLTQLYLKKFGIVHVSVSNTSPSIFNNGNDIIVGHPSKWEDDFESDEAYAKYENDVYGNWKKIGHICTGLWWVTIIEEEKLTKILKKEYFDEYDKATKIKVEPGKYLLKYCGDHEKFAELNEDTRSMENFVTPFFTLTKLP